MPFLGWERGGGLFLNIFWSIEREECVRVTEVEREREMRMVVVVTSQTKTANAIFVDFAHITAARLHQVLQCFNFKSR
jgi:hypothetical protein